MNFTKQFAVLKSYSLWLAIALLYAASPLSAFAQNDEAPGYTNLTDQAPTQLILAGRGMVDHRGNSIALACVSASEVTPCDTVQFFAIIDGKFGWIGSREEILSDSERRYGIHTGELVQNVVAKRLKQFIKRIQSQAQESNSGGFFKWFLPPAVYSGSMAAGILVWTAGSGFGILIPFAAVYGLAKLVVQKPGQDLVHGLTTGKVVAETLTQNNGWNWSSDAKNVSNDVFSAYLCTQQFYASHNSNAEMRQSVGTLCSEFSRLHRGPSQ